MKVTKTEQISDAKLEQIKRILPQAENLLQLMTWANSHPKNDFIERIIAEVIVQDEFTHDVIIPFQDVFLVFDTT